MKFLKDFADKLIRFKKLLYMYHWLAKLGLGFVLYLQNGRKPEDAKKIIDQLIQPFENQERSKK